MMQIPDAMNLSSQGDVCVQIEECLSKGGEGGEFDGVEGWVGFGIADFQEGGGV